MKNTMNTPVAIPASKLHPFEGHPYKVLDNEESSFSNAFTNTSAVISSALCTE